ncbi:flagellar hook-associated protein 3 FlgL [Desulfohalotomaculum tongense]|uniref:flagellar hook-associated protein FlgL n=1 Tax=Desulforadius tongensis TaxID=1216062 RepID=UPI00195737E6|nr:flagellar hook-associated protein FlgL [Desulforadius tongensis]MBM7856054.1 flagellar hook-associated protein 3 FlgL [Desulforadius tongensis]
MRITNRYMANAILNSIQGNLSKLARSQEQLATSKRLLRPSDDPNVMGQFMSIKATLSYNQQYGRNIDDGLSYLEMNDTAMGTLGDVLSKAKEYAIQAANDTYDAEDRKAVAEQIDKMIDQVVDLGNSTVGGKYIYAGTKSDNPPFERSGDTIIYKGDLNGVYREVLAGTDYRIDAPGVTTSGEPGVFGTAADNGDGTYTVGEGIFKTLFDLRNRLRNNDAQGLQESIGDLDQKINHLLRHRVAVGARSRHFESLKTQLLDQEVKLTQSLENIEGADVAKLSIEYKQQQLAYNASLAVGANIMNTSLLNFLK